MAGLNGAIKIRFAGSTRVLHLKFTCTSTVCMHKQDTVVVKLAHGAAWGLLFKDTGRGRTRTGLLYLFLRSGHKYE